MNNFDILSNFRQPQQPIIKVIHEKRKSMTDTKGANNMIDEILINGNIMDNSNNMIDINMNQLPNTYNNNNSGSNSNILLSTGICIPPPSSPHHSTFIPSSSSLPIQSSSMLPMHSSSSLQPQQPSYLQQQFSSSSSIVNQPQIMHVQQHIIQQYQQSSPLQMNNYQQSSPIQMNNYQSTPPPPVILPQQMIQQPYDQQISMNDYGYQSQSIQAVQQQLQYQAYAVDAMNAPQIQQNYNQSYIAPYFPNRKISNLDGEEVNIFIDNSVVADGDTIRAAGVNRVNYIENAMKYNYTQEEYNDIYSSSDGESKKKEYNDVRMPFDEHKPPSIRMMSNKYRQKGPNKV